MKNEPDRNEETNTKQRLTKVVRMIKRITTIQLTKWVIEWLLGIPMDWKGD